MRVRFRTDIYERSVICWRAAGSLRAVDSSLWRSYRDVDAAGDPGSLGGQLDGIASVPFVAAEKARSLELLGLIPGGSVLDVGCGTGPELERMADIVGPGGRVVGLDRSAALLGGGAGAKA